MGIQEGEGEGKNIGLSEHIRKKKIELHKRRLKILNGTSIKKHMEESGLLLTIPNGWVFDGDSIDKIPWDKLERPESVFPIKPHDGCFGHRFGDAKKAYQELEEERERLRIPDAITLFVLNWSNRYGIRGVVDPNDLENPPDVLRTEKNHALKGFNFTVANSKNVALAAVGIGNPFE